MARSGNRVARSDARPHLAMPRAAPDDPGRWDSGTCGLSVADPARSRGARDTAAAASRASSTGARGHGPVRASDPSFEAAPLLVNDAWGTQTGPTDRAEPPLSPTHVLALQRTAGNRAVTAALQRTRSGSKPHRTVRSIGAGRPRRPALQRALVSRRARIPRRARVAQRAPARAPAPAPTKSDQKGAQAGQTGAPAGQKNSYIDLLNGFTDLATAAVNQGGRGLDTAKFGPDLTASHRRLLERIRRVLILAQEASADSRSEARSQWPGVESKLQAAVSEARKLGLPDKNLAIVADNLALVAERYIKVRRRGPSEVETPDGYLDLFNGIQALLIVIETQSTDKRDTVVPLNLTETNKAQRAALAAVKFGGRLTTRHKALLEALRRALVLARTEEPGSARKALAEWKTTQAQLRHVFERAPNYIETDVSGFQARLHAVGEGLIRGGVYSEAHHEARSKTQLPVPNRAFEVEKFRAAATDMAEAEKLAKKALQMTGEAVFDNAIKKANVGKLGGPIMDMIKYPGEVSEKLEEYQKRGVVGKSVTVADLAEKTLKLRNAVMEVSFSATKRYAEFAVSQAIKRGDMTAWSQWGKIRDWAGKHLEVLEKVKKVTVVISIVVSAIKVIDLISQGKWAEAAQEAAEASATLLASFATGLAGTAMIAGIAVILAAEAEGLHGAAEMIRYCRETNVRMAASDFIGTCVEAARNEAQDFVTDVKLLEDPANAGQRDIIEKKIRSYVPYWVRHVGDLADQLNNTRPMKLGGQPPLQAALGPMAVSLLRSPSIYATNQWDQTAQHIRLIFHGANAMAAYVVKTYPRADRPQS